MNLIETLIVPFVCAGAVYGIRFYFWKEEVPKILEKIRWFLAFLLMIGINVAGVFMQTNMKVTSFVAALVAVYTASALKNDKKEKE